jgi:hypothetical protein
MYRTIHPACIAVNRKPEESGNIFGSTFEAAQIGHVTNRCVENRYEIPYQEAP